MSSFLLACGGTGGHLTPGISLAETLIARGHRCTLLVSRKKIDSQFLEQHPHLHFERLPHIVPGQGPLSIFRTLYGQFRSLVFCFRLLGRERPDTVIAFGGFTAPGVGLASRLRRCPLVLHEANRIPGKALRLLGPLADRVYLPEGIHLPGVSRRRERAMGYPLRQQIHRCDKASARAKLKLHTHGKLLLILGGSQGADPLNHWLTEYTEQLTQQDIHIYCVAGPGKKRPSPIDYQSAQGQTTQVQHVAFTEHMGLLLSAADLVIARSGAGCIAELIHCRTPSILVPYPHAPSGHRRQ